MDFTAEELAEELRARDAAASKGRWIASPFGGFSGGGETTWLMAADKDSPLGAVTISGDLSLVDARLVTFLVNLYRRGHLVVRVDSQEP